MRSTVECCPAYIYLRIWKRYFQTHLHVLKVPSCSLCNQQPSYRIQRSPAYYVFVVLYILRQRFDYSSAVFADDCFEALSHIRDKLAGVLNYTVSTFLIVEEGSPKHRTIAPHSYAMLNATASSNTKHLSKNSTNLSLRSSLFSGNGVWLSRPISFWIMGSIWSLDGCESLSRD